MDKDRKSAYLALLRMEKDGAWSNIMLNHLIEEEKPQSPAFVRELTYGVLERKYYLDYLLAQLLTQSIRILRKEAHVLLAMGMYQIIFMDSVPDHAACDECVKLAKKYCRAQSGFINAVLRNFLRKRDSLKQPESEKDPVRRFSALYSYEPWIIQLWIAQFGEARTEKLLAAGNEKPPFTVRVNLLRTSVEELKERLAKQQIQCRSVPSSERVLELKGSQILKLPEYREGLFSVQDTASVIAMEHLSPQAGDTVIDTCAAPFGKTLCCAEIMENQGTILAFDKYPNKIKGLHREAERLGIRIAQAAAADATVPREELFEAADRVICDVPCSGLGVIRRKPEIKYKQLPDGGRELAALQLRILENASRYVRPGGVLQYSTCTINRIENEDVTRAFLASHPAFSETVSRQLMPDEDGTDGFYFCRMKRAE